MLKSSWLCTLGLGLNVLLAFPLAAAEGPQQLFVQPALTEAGRLKLQQQL